MASEAERDLGCQDREVSGRLSLGVFTTIAQYVLSILLTAFLADYPQVDFTLHSGNSDKIVHLLLDGKVVLGLIEGPARNRGVRTEPFMEDELVLIAPPDTQASELARIECLKSNLFLREHGSGSRRVVEAALKKVGLPLRDFRKVTILDSTEAIKSAVEVCQGLGFVSRWAISKELELSTLKLVEVRGLRVSRRFSALSRGQETGLRPLRNDFPTSSTVTPQNRYQN